MKNGEYNLIKAPECYPGKRYRGKYAYEHWVVWWLNTGQLPEQGQVVHHVNHDKRDNRFENLAILQFSAHSRLHYTRVAEITSVTCHYCGEVIDRQARDVRSRLKAGYKHSYCCRSHQLKQQWKDGTALGGKYHKRL